MAKKATKRGKKLVRIGMLGCGHIGNYHVKCLKQVEGAEVVAAYDPDTKNAKALAERAGSGCKVYDDGVELIEQAEIDAVYLCVPPFAHGEFEQAAVKRGLPMFIEKPVTASLAQAKKIYKMLPADLPVSVAYNWRYMPNVPHIKKALGKKKPLGFVAVWKEGLPPARWWRVTEESGGPIVEQASHLLDFGMFMLGPIKSVQAYANYNRKKDWGDINDLWMVNFEYESGAIGQLVHTCLLNGKIHRIGYDIIAQDLEISCERDASVTIRSQKGVETLPGNYDMSYVNESEAFVKAVRTGNTKGILCDYREGMMSLALGEAITKSVNTGKRVNVPKV